MDFQLRFTDKEITAWGGLSLLKRILDHMGFDTALTDSGFSDDGFLRDLERRGLHYIVAARLQQPLQRALVSQKGWRTYRGRTDCKNRIKELKYDFAADSFCLNNFFATEACLNTVMMAYNLMSLFRQAALKSSVIESGGKDVQHTLKTLRYKLFAKAGYITTEGRKSALKLAIAIRQREWFEGLWDQSKSFELPVKFSPIFRP